MRAKPKGKSEKVENDIDWGILGVIVLLAGILRFFGLADQPLVCDEAVHRVVSGYFVRDGLLSPFGHWHHPPLRYYFLALSSRLFGDSLLSLRFFSAFFGALTVALLFFMVREVTRRNDLSYLAAFFLAFELLHAGMSRLALEDAILTFFVLLAAYFFCLFTNRSKSSFLGLSGIAWGVAMAAKWQAVFLLPAFIFYIGWKSFVQTKRINWVKITAVGLTVLLLGVSVYLLAYLPWFQRGFSVSEWLDLQLAMGKTVAGVQLGDYRVGSTAYQPLKWFLLPSYLTFFVSTAVQNQIQVVIATTSLLIWLLIIPSLVVLIKTKRSAIFDNLLVVLFLFMFGPFVLSPRPIYLYSATIITPFVAYLAAHFLVFLAETPKLKVIAPIYTGLVVLNFLFFYPLIAGIAFKSGLYERVLSLFLSI